MPYNKKNDKKDGILFYVKYPIKGHVKSRLNPKVPPEKSTSLYRNFVDDILLTLNKTLLSIIICYEPSNHILQFHQWLGNNYTFYPQIGNDLGQRLENGFHQGFSDGYKKLLVIGSDSPDLSTSMIQNAMDQLENNDAIIGPSTDGGYYILGLKAESYKPDIFHDIQWSTEHVFTETLNRLHQHKLKIKILPKWYDIDTYEDLYDLYTRNLKTSFKNSKTMQELIQYFKEVT